MLPRCGVIALMLSSVWAVPPARAQFALTDDDCVVFYGDTAFAEYQFTKWLDLFMRIRYPELTARTINMGRKGNETGRALENLDQELLVFRPTRAVLCFGLEDAKLRPFAPKLLERFVTNLGKIVDRLEHAGVKVILVTPPVPELHKNNGLKHAKYVSVMQKYADAVRALAREKKTELIDWNHAAAGYIEKHPPGPTCHMTRDGLMPVARSIALLIDALLVRWNAQPIEQNITLHWTGTDAVEVTTGEGSIFQRSGDRVLLTLKDVPVPLEMPDPKMIPPDQWPLAHWSSYVLKIPDAPEDGGFTLACSGKTTAPVDPAALRAGVDLGALGVFLNHHPVHDLNIRAITKANQFLQYRESLHRPVPEPELKEGYRLYSKADLALARGAYKVFLRTPSRMTARLEIAHLDEDALKQARKKAAQPPGRKGRFPRRVRRSGGK